MSFSPLHSVVGGMMNMLRMQYMLIASAAVVLLTLDPLDRWFNWQAQTVEIGSVRALCIAFQQTDRKPLGQGDCATVRANFEGKVDVQVSAQTFLYFTYTSPVDNLVHNGTIVDTAAETGKPIMAGQKIDVLVSTKDADLVKLRQ